MTMQWGRNYMVCKHTQCSNWIWTDKVRSGTHCRKCGTWWPDTGGHTGKGKGYGKPANKPILSNEYASTTDLILQNLCGKFKLKVLCQRAK